jgi:adenylate cyclase
MIFEEALAHIIEALQQEHRISYRALKRRFDLDDELLEDLKEELIYAKQLATDEDGRVLVWAGEAPMPLASVEGRSQAGSQVTRPTIPLPQAVPSTVLPPPEADRRPVTVLFADLSGFTTLSERLDPEEVRAFQSDLFQEMASVVEHYEGFVEKFVGDAIMAVFGAPLAHEDDPERSLRAALAMHDRMGAINRRWEYRLGESLALHIGVNTGPVVAGNLGATSGAAYAVTGDTVNTASRLQGAAQPGQTLVGVTTYSLTQHVFEFEGVGDLALKGKAEPLQVYRLLHVLDRVRSARGLASYSLVAPLVGRDDELGQMRAAFDGMLRCEAQVVSLVGEAGVGKSRLLKEFLSILASGEQLQQTTVRQAACSALGEQPYGVLAAFLRDAYSVAPNDSIQVTRSKLTSGLRALGVHEDETTSIVLLIDHLLRLESDSAVWRHVEPEQLKRQIFDVVRTLFERRLQQGPLLLVVEDLQWADTASIEILRFMVDRLSDFQLMFVFTYRPVFEAQGLLASQTTHTVVGLEPLSTGQSEALLDAFFGPSAGHLPARLRELIVMRAGGNPFYLEEVLRGLIAGGVLVREHTGWTCAADVATVDVPPTLQGLLLSRIDRLPTGIRRLLQEAAVLGPVFNPELLRLICSEPHAYESSLQRLCDAGLLVQASPASDSPPLARDEQPYGFTHTLVQEVVYQNLLVRQRTDLHGQVGQALETLCAGQPQRLEDVATLGHHFSLSHDKAKGAQYLVAAGDWARALYANDDAIRHYERVLHTLSACGFCEVDQFLVQERLGDLFGLIGRRETSLVHYEEVVRAYETAGDRPGAARMQRKIGGLHWDAGDRDRALACFETGLAHLAGHDEHIELAHLYQEMGRIAFRGGDNARAIEWAERALTQAEHLATSFDAPRASHDPEAQQEVAAAISHACNTLGVALARMDRLDEAVTYIERSGTVAQTAGLLQVACRSYANLGVLYSEIDPSRAIATCLNGLEVAKKIGDLGFQSRLYANLAIAYCTLTNRCDEEGIGAAQAAIDLDRRLGQLDHLAVPLIVLGQIYQCHGEPDLARGHYQEALDLAEEAGEPQLLFPCYEGLATLYLEMGEVVQAEQYMLKAQQVCEQAELDPDSLVLLPFLC